MAYHPLIAALLIALLAPHLHAGARPLIANAGPDRHVPPGHVELDGRASRHPAGAPLSYQWSFTGGPAPAKLSNDTIAQPATDLMLPGTYTFGLRVYDPYQTSTMTEVAITVDDLPPSCGAGRDAQVPTGRVELKGWASDPNGQALTTTWIQTAGPKPAVLADPRALTTSFDVPVDATGVYVFVLRASDGAHTTSSAPVSIDVDDPPVAEAYANPEHPDPGAKVDLNGMGSNDKNPEDDPLTYAWSIVSGPDHADLSGADQPYAKLVAKRGGDYTVRLDVASKTNRKTASTTVVVHVKNLAPVAQIAKPATGHRGDVQLDGAASSDENGDPLTYEWKQVGGDDELRISDPASPRPTVSAAKPGTYRIQLVVKDAELESSPATASVTFENTAPVPVVVPVITCRPGIVLLDAGRSVDRDGDGIRYFWRQVDGPARVRIEDPGTYRPRVGFGVPGTYGFELQVNDGVAYSFPVRVTVNVQR